VSGDVADTDPDAYMLLCGSCNRSKSWSCEHCENWQKLKSPEICLTCYWANPQDYNHIALRQMRRVDLTWDAGEIDDYEQLKKNAQEHGLSLIDFIKKFLKTL